MFSVAMHYVFAWLNKQQVQQRMMNHKWEVMDRIEWRMELIPLKTCLSSIEDTKSWKTQMNNVFRIHHTNIFCAITL